VKGNQAKWALWGLVVLCLALVGLAFFFGGSIPTLAALLLLALVVALATGVFGSGARHSNRTRTQGMIAIILGLVGSVLGFWSALFAFLAVGTDPLYRDRLWAGWLALLLPVLAFLATLWLRMRPIPASLLILLSGLGGFVCINLFFINTFYALAIPFWVLAVAVGLART
jgi:hypothetical protein